MCKIGLCLIGTACCSCSPYTFQGLPWLRSHSQFFVDVHLHQLNPAKNKQNHTQQLIVIQMKPMGWEALAYNNLFEHVLEYLNMHKMI